MNYACFEAGIWNNSWNQIKSFTFEAGICDKSWNHINNTQHNNINTNSSNGDTKLGTEMTVEQILELANQIDQFVNVNQLSDRVLDFEFMSFYGVAEVNCVEFKAFKSTG